MAGLRSPFLLLLETELLAYCCSRGLQQRRQVWSGGHSLTLANMASSKSNRASSGRSSTSASLSSASVYSANTTADRNSSLERPSQNPETNEVPEKQSPPTIELASSSLEPSTQSDVAREAAASAQHEAPNQAGQMAIAGPVLMPPQPRVMRKQSKLRRLSSFFPSLISPTSDSGRNPLPTGSPIKEKQSTMSEWEAQLRNRFESKSADNLTLALNESSGHKKHASQDAGKAGKLKKQPGAPPPLPQSPAPPLPSAATENSITPKDAGFYFTETQPSKLKKPNPRRRSNSHAGAASPPKQDGGLLPRAIPPSSIEPRGRSSSAQPPSTRLEPVAGNRQVSAAAALSPRPTSSNGSQSPTREGEKRGRLRRSWFPGGRSRSNSTDLRGAQSAAAWTLGQTKSDYNTAFLEKGEHVPELWNESGNVLVYLHPKSSGKGPSFKVMSFVTDYSLFFQDLVEAEAHSPATGRTRSTSFTGRDSLSVADADRIAERDAESPPSPPLSENAGDSRLYLASKLNSTGQLQPGDGPQPDLDRLISFRNLFALLTGQPLVGTKSQPTIFAVLVRISGLLAEVSEFVSCKLGREIGRFPSRDTEPLWNGSIHQSLNDVDTNQLVFSMSLPVSTVRLLVTPLT